MLQIFELESLGLLIKSQALEEFPTIKFLWEFSEKSLGFFIKSQALKECSTIKFLWEFSEKYPAVQLDIISTISLATRKCICSFCALLSVMMWVAFAQ